MKKLLLSACICSLALLAGAAGIPDPPHMPKRPPKVCRIGGWYADQKLKPGRSWLPDMGVFFTAPPSLKLANAPGGKAQEIMVTQYLPKLKPDTGYRLSAYVRLKDVKPITRGGGVVLNLFDAGNRWYPTHFLTGSRNVDHDG